MKFLRITAAFLATAFFGSVAPAMAQNLLQPEYHVVLLENHIGPDLNGVEVTRLATDGTEVLVASFDTGRIPEGEQYEVVIPSSAGCNLVMKVSTWPLPASTPRWTLSVDVCQQPAGVIELHRKASGHS